VRALISMQPKYFALFLDDLIFGKTLFLTASMLLLFRHNCIFSFYFPRRAVILAKTFFALLKYLTRLNLLQGAPTFTVVETL